MSERDAFIKHTSKEEMADELTARFEQIQRLNEIIRIEQERSATLQAAKQQAEQEFKAAMDIYCHQRNKHELEFQPNCECPVCNVHRLRIAAEQKARALEAYVHHTAMCASRGHSVERLLDKSCDCGLTNLLSTQTEETRGE